MKKLLLSVTLLLAGAMALAGPQDPADIRLTQNIEPFMPGGTSTGITTRYIPVPGNGLQAVMYLDGTTRLPRTAIVGTGLSIVNGTLTADTGMPSDWNATSGPAAILNKPTFATIAYTGDWADLFNKPATWAPSPHTHAWADITSGKPTTLAGYGITDGVSSTALASYATTASLSGYATTSALTTGLAGKFNTPTGTTSQYVRGDGSLAALPAGMAFNYGDPVARTLAVSTAYQATDTTRAAVIYPSFACQNATTVLAASGCTLQVRIGTAGLTCSTGTVYYTQSLTVGLGLLITQNSTNPVPIFLPAGRSFIFCPSVGTFAITAVEQTAG